MIGYSDGKSYDNDMDELLDRPITPNGRGAGASTEPADALKPGGGYPGSGEIDREHHVPLVASALLDKDGSMTGMAIDSRIPAKPEFEKHLWDHEAYENEYMQHLLKNGYSNQDAYHKAHDWSTQRESAAVEAEFGKDGLDAYKQHWRDAASVAAEPSDKEVHPNAHTTIYGLDKAELGQKFQEKVEQGKDILKGVADPLNLGKVLSGQSEHPYEDVAEGLIQSSMPEMKLGIFAGAMAKTADMGLLNKAKEMFGNAEAKETIWNKTGWFKGADGKWRHEIPDAGAKLKESAIRKTIIPDEHTWDKVGGLDKYDLSTGSKDLKDVLDHPELFKAYPELKDLEVRSVDHGVFKAAYDNNSKTIYLNTHTSLEDMKASLLHEVQHAVQDMEGFDPGGNKHQLLPYVRRAAGLDPRDSSTAQREMELAYEAYRRLTGETEARNVEKRKDMGDLERYLRHPHTTMDVPLKDQITPPR
jgi:Large polyvalent protein associated domain 23